LKRCYRDDLYNNYFVGGYLVDYIFFAFDDTHRRQLFESCSSDTQFDVDNVMFDYGFTYDFGKLVEGVA
jgi:hypothetical protein